MSRPRVYADFHNLDDENRIRLTCDGTSNDLRKHNIELREGLELTFYMDDANDEGEEDALLINGVAHYDEKTRCWVGIVDWSATRHASEEKVVSVNGVPLVTDVSQAKAN